jgi:hypothetical protein
LEDGKKKKKKALAITPANQDASNSHGPTRQIKKLAHRYDNQISAWQSKKPIFII